MKVIAYEAATEIETLRRELEEARCPIGLDNSPSICSAGYCRECLSSRLTATERELEEARSLLERFRTWARENVDVIPEEYDWFGPSDFRPLRPLSEGKEGQNG